MIKKLLIANRGEIACRVMRTAQRLGIATVAVYSEADARALHVATADQAVHIGEAPAAQSYLRADAILDAARATGADAVHPGYGFLSENARFARACEDAGIVFVGPTAAAITAMGSKREALTLMAEHGVPVLAGYRGAAQDDAALLAAAAAVGFPLIVKPSAGGGGKGMQVARDAAELTALLPATRRVARAAFGDDTLLLERCLERPRHVEVQVFADAHGNFVHLFERDCSVQRRHQKVVEEAPAPDLPQAMRDAMGDAAVRAAKAIDYRGAGTVEFLYDPPGGGFYFMEMNTRLQVEHPVTEMITGVDLVEWQLLVAAGKPLPVDQADLRCHGHAIEVRLYAEDPERDFLPATGALDWLSLPDGEGIRVDSGVRTGDAVGVHYDPMIAKLVVHGDNREQAVDRLRGALGATRIGPLASNLGFLRSLAQHAQWRQGAVDTNFLARESPALAPRHLPDDEALAAAGSWIATAPPSAPATPWDLLRGMRLNLPSCHRVRLSLSGQDSDVTLERSPGSVQVHLAETVHRTDLARRDGSILHFQDGTRAVRISVHEAGESLHLDDGEAVATVIRLPAAAPAGADQMHGAGQLIAPMPGRVVTLNARQGDRVEAGQALVVLEAMKMEHTLKAPGAGMVEHVGAREGAQVEEGTVLVSLLLD